MLCPSSSILITHVEHSVLYVAKLIKQRRKKRYFLPCWKIFRLSCFSPFLTRNNFFLQHWLTDRVNPADTEVRHTEPHATWWHLYLLLLSPLHLSAVCLFSFLILLLRFASVCQTYVDRISKNVSLDLNIWPIFQLRLGRHCLLVVSVAVKTSNSVECQTSETCY